MKKFSELSKSEIQNLSTDDFVAILRESLLAGPLQIYQFPNKPIPSSNDLFLLSNTSSGNITNNINLSQFLTNYINVLAQISPSQVTGTALISTNNLSDVQDIGTSASNLGVKNGLFYITGGEILTAPLPRRIGFNIASSGQTLQLPDATTLNINSLTDIYFFDNYSNFDVTLLAGDGSTIQTINAGTKYWYSCDSNSSIAGQWYLWPWIGSVNDSSKYLNIIDLNSAYAQTASQNFTINSGLNLLGGSLNIGGPSVSGNSLLSTTSTTQGSSPFPTMTTAQMNAIPVTFSDAGLVVYVTDLLDGIYYFDGASWTYLENSGGGSGSLQAAYTGGNTVSLSSGRPVIFSTQTAATNFAVFSPSFTSRTYDTIEGVRFTVSSNGFVTALQYVNVNFSSGARQVGIYRVSDQALLVADLVYKSDPLDSTGNYRTHAIDPIPLVTGESYIVIAVVPANEQWLFYAPMTAPPPFTYTGIVYDIPSSILIYPPSVISGVAVYGNASLQYSVSQSILNINDGTATSMLNIQSTKQGFSPPVWTSTQEGMNIVPLGSGDSGLSWYNSTISAPTYWDGGDQHYVLSTDHVNAGSNISIDYSNPGQITISSSGGGSGPSASWGSFVLNNNGITITASTTYSPIPGTGSFIDKSSSDFNDALFPISSTLTPVAIYIGSTTQYFTVNCSISAFIGSVVANNYYLNIFILKANGSVIDTGFVNSVNLKNINDAQIISVTGSVQLSTGDGVFFQIKADSTANILIKYLTADITNKTGSISSTDGLSQGTSNLYLSQNGGSTYRFLSGSGTVGNLSKFNSAGGQLIDSGILASNVVQNDGSTYNINISGNAATATNSTNIATTQVSSNASYFPLMAASSTNGNQAADLATGLTFNPSTNTLNTSVLQASNSLQIATTTAKATSLTSVGPGGNTASTYIAYFGSTASPTATNVYQIAIDRNGTESLLMGINKNTNTNQINANGAFISTFSSTGTLSLGRGAGNGLPNTADLSVDGSGNVYIYNGYLQFSGANGALTGINNVIQIFSTYVSGSFINCAGSGRNIGVTTAGSHFKSCGLDYNATTHGYQYKNSSTGTGCSLELTPSGVFNFLTAPSGSTGGAATVTTQFSIGNTGTVNVNSLSASSLVGTDGSKNLISVTASSSNTPNTVVERDGSGNFSAGTITATAITSGGLTDGSILFSDASGTISQNNSKLFWDNSSNNIYIGASTADTLQLVGRINSRSTNNTITGSQNFFTDFDSFPMLQVLPYSHNNVQINFDSFYSGTQIVASANSSFQFSKGATTLSINYAASSQGSVIGSWSTALQLNSSGQISLPNLTASQAVVTDSGRNLSSLAYTNINTASTLVQRDASGNFSAGTITASLAGTSTNSTNIATTQVSSNASYFPLMAASSTNGNQAADLATGLTFNPSTNTLNTSVLQGSSVQAGTTTNNGALTVGGVGGTTYAASRLAYFGSVSTATAGNIYMINIDKAGQDGLLLGMNKNSATGQVLSNGIFLSSYQPGGSISIGRGNGSGLPNTADLQVDTSGNVTILNGNLNVANLSASGLIATDSSKNLTSSISGLSPLFTGLTLGGSSVSAPSIPTQLNLSSSTQNQARLALTGNSFAGNSSTEGIGFILAYNATNNRQLYIVDTARAASSSTNAALRVSFQNTGSNYVQIDALATNGAVALNLILGDTGSTLTLQGTPMVMTGGDTQLATGNLVIQTATSGYQQKSAAVSAGTANSTLVTGVVLTSGASGTINNSSITTSHVGFATVTTRSGTATTQYVVTCSAGSFSVSGGSLDNSTLAIHFIKAL